MQKYDKNARNRIKFKHYRDEKFHILQTAEAKNEISARVFSNVLEGHFYAIKKVQLRNKRRPGEKL
jgi:hypothetical protein